jgi:hypothetical protein
MSIDRDRTLVVGGDFGTLSGRAPRGSAEVGGVVQTHSTYATAWAARVTDPGDGSSETTRARTFATPRLRERARFLRSPSGPYGCRADDGGPRPACPQEKRWRCCERQSACSMVMGLGAGSLARSRHCLGWPGSESSRNGTRRRPETGGCRSDVRGVADADWLPQSARTGRGCWLNTKKRALTR